MSKVGRRKISVCCLFCLMFSDAKEHIRNILFA